MLASARQRRKRAYQLRANALESVRRRPGPDAQAAELARWQFITATDAVVGQAEELAEQRLRVPAVGSVDVTGLAGTASDGRSLAGLMTQADTDSAFKMIVATQLADLARQAAGIAVTSRPRIGFIRIVGPGACARCVILAGRFYRWNDGFLRHPNCGCEHVSTLEATAEDLAQNPYEFFESLSEAEQDRTFTKAGAEAIRDGADISQVVNARRGMTENGMFTTEGMTRRGYAGQLLGKDGQRLTPEAIYAQAGGDRAKAVQGLVDNGYITPAGQVPLGALRGQREGFGRFGAGGRRVAARRAVEEARRSGVRDPNSRYTMTAAELRLYDSRLRYEAALERRNPYGREAWSPSVLERARKDYYRWLGTNGQVFV